MMSRPGEVMARTQMSGVGTMLEYLKTRHAELIKRGSAC
jgi:hypothetical protein